MNRRLHRLTMAACVGSVLLFARSLAAEEQQPLWELGVGVAAMSQSHYYGADDSRAYVLPFPYFRYNGRILQADRGGIQLKLFRTDRLSLGVSGGGSFPVDSEDSDERTGMPDLDMLGEVGPNLRWDLIDDEQLLLQFQWPVRAAFSFGDDFGEFQGWTSNPRLATRFSDSDWTYETSFGPVFSSRDYHGYIYDVAPQYATAQRPQYRASSGYTGLRFSFDMDRYYGRNMQINLFINYFNLNGAENDSSPLFRREHNFTAGVTVAWILQRSRRSVPAGPDS